MVSGIDTYLPKNALSLLPIKWYDNLFKKDWDISSLSWIKNLQIHDNGFSNSLFLSRIYNQIRSAQLARYAEEFPRGVPAQTKRDNFLLETAIDWVTANLEASPEPFFSYIHMLPPHSPYRTRRDFVDRFLADGYQPIKKPHHIFGQKPITYQEQTESRRIYDEYLLYVDSEFQRLIDNLSRRGILENTIVILTSDHGEMFERGIPEHLDPSFHRPVMHIPLIIFPPGQSERVDIHSLTTTVDLLPTILHLTGNTAASLLEGEILPPFNPADQSNRTIFSVDFRHSYKSKKLTNGTIMICSKEYKFTYLFGTKGRYAKLPESVLYELFDISRDPEEMKNLYDPKDPLSQMFLKMMEEKLAEKKLELVRYD